MQLLREFHILDTDFTSQASAIWRRFALSCVLCAFVSACGPASESQRLNSRVLSQSEDILADVAGTELLLSPETATRLGLDDLGASDSTARLDDHSQAGFERKRLLRLDLLALLQTRPRLPADHPLARDLQIVEDGLQRMMDLQIIGHGRLDLSEIHPYAIDPFSSIWIEGPGLMVNDQLVRSEQDALAYLERLWALSDAIDDTRRRLIADAEAGLSPPAALVEETARAVSAFSAPEGGQLERLVETYSNRLQSLVDIDPAEADQLVADSALVIQDGVRPAYQRLIETLRDLQTQTSVHGGFWAQPDGYQSYRRILHWYTDQSQPLDDLHETNLEDVAAFAAQFDAVLTQAALDPAPLQARLLQLQQQIEAPIALSPEGIADPVEAEPALPMPAGPLTIVRPLTPATLSGFRYLPARLDAQRPALVATYPEQVARWPAYLHAALQLQEDISLRQPFSNMGTQRRSPARALLTYPAIQDAWHMLACETLGADYLSDAYDEIGLAHLLLFNAAMAAADTGLHHKRWTLDQTTNYLSQTTGLPAPLMREATLRIAAEPGKAAARLIGYRYLKALRTRARAVLGDRYDEITFYSVLLTDGPRPFVIIEQDVERWYEDQLETTG